MKGQPILPRVIFMSRWLQTPLYLGLVLAQALYAVRFIHEVWRLLIEGLFFNETKIMLSILGLVDVVLISNLLIMVIVGGYETFVSRLRIESHPDKPEWLESVGPGTLKIKLAMALISISSIHLLSSFIDVENQTQHELQWQVLIHLTLLLSAVATAWVDKASHIEEEV